MASFHARARESAGWLILPLVWASLLVGAGAPAAAQQREPGSASERLQPLTREQAGAPERPTPPAKGASPALRPRPAEAVRQPAPLRPGGLAREDMKQLVPPSRGTAAPPPVADKPVARPGKGAAGRADLCRESDFSGFYDGAVRVAPLLTFRSRGGTDIAVHRLAPGVTAYVETLSAPQRSVLNREQVSGQDPAQVVQALMRPGRKIPDAVKRLSLEHQDALKRSGQPRELSAEEKAGVEDNPGADIASFARSLAATIRQRKCVDVDWNSVENVRKWKKMEAALEGIAADPFKMPARPTPQDLQKNAVPPTEKPSPLSKPEIAQSFCQPCQWHTWWDQNYGKNYQHNWGCVDYTDMIDTSGHLNTFDGSFLKDQQPGDAVWITMAKGMHLGWDENHPFFKNNYVDLISRPGDFRRVTFSVSGANFTRVRSYAFTYDPCVFFSLGLTVNN